MSAGERRHVVTVEHVAQTAAPSGEGYVEAVTVGTPPTWYVAISAATARDQERATQGTVLATASHLVRGAYRRDLTLQSQLVYGDRILRVIHVEDPDERHVETIAACVQVLP